jgi:Asp-tRNA(Asn)/Glu-tRNA(Gln) amidotransferase A subunit family amidase
LNGVYGHKTTYGLINNENQYPPSQTMPDMKEKMLTSGPICRYASDLRLLIEVQAGDRFASYKQNFQKQVNLSKLKYYVITDYEECIFASKVSDASKNGINKV